MSDYELLNLIFTIILQSAILIVSIINLIENKKKSYPSDQEK